MLRIGMAFVLFAVVGVIGCGPAGGSGTGGDKKANPIVGTWEASDPEMKGMTLLTTFTADGKVSMELVIEGMPKDDPKVKIDNKQEGTYKLEDKVLTLTMKGEDKKNTVKELTADKMVITNSQGKDMNFTKKK